MKFLHLQETINHLYMMTVLRDGANEATPIPSTPFHEFPEVQVHLEKMAIKQQQQQQQ